MNVQCHRSRRTKDMDAAEFRSRRALGCARIAGSLGRRLPEHSVKIAPAKQQIFPASRIRIAEICFPPDRYS
jgi:hypothetical protein